MPRTFLQQVAKRSPQYQPPMPELRDGTGAVSLESRPPQARLQSPLGWRKLPTKRDALRASMQNFQAARIFQSCATAVGPHLLVTPRTKCREWTITPQRRQHGREMVPREEK